METKLSKATRPALLSNWFTRDPFYTIREDFDNMISRLKEDWNGNGNGETTVHQQADRTPGNSARSTGPASAVNDKANRNVVRKSPIGSLRSKNLQPQLGNLG